MNIDNAAQGNPAQRPRIAMEPYDRDHLMDQIFRDTLFKSIPLSTLEQDDAYLHFLDMKYLDVLLLRIVTRTGVTNIYGKKKKDAKEQLTFKRLFLCKVVSQTHLDDNCKLIYLVESTNQNTELWKQNHTYRDSGAIHIGSVLRIPSPMAVEKYMKNDIPMIVTDQKLHLLQFPSHFDPTKIDYQIEANTSLAFLYNRIKLSMYSLSFVKTSCSGLLCDRQRVGDWNNRHKCGCYGMLPSRSSLIAKQFLQAHIGRDVKLTAKDFSSLQFSDLYLKEFMPGKVVLSQLQLTPKYVLLRTCAFNCIALINENGGFTIIGWYKKGIINDKSLIDEESGQNNKTDVQTESGELSYHITCIVPTNRDFLDVTTGLGKRLHEKKFDVRSLLTNEEDSAAAAAAGSTSSTAQGNS